MYVNQKMIIQSDSVIVLLKKVFILRRNKQMQCSKSDKLPEESCSSDKLGTFAKLSIGCFDMPKLVLCCHTSKGCQAGKRL